MPSLHQADGNQGVGGMVIVLRPQRLERPSSSCRKQGISVDKDPRPSGVSLVWEPELWGGVQVGARDGTVFYSF